MPDDKNNISGELERMVRKADHLSNFGTLTSLVSTAAYFIETTFVKKLPKWVSVATLSAVGVGIMSVVGSYYYKFKAGRIALQSSAQAGPQPQATLPQPSDNTDTATGQKWTKKVENMPTPPSEVAH